MNRTKLFILALAGIFAVACATDGVDQMGTTPQQTAMLKKFVNTPQAAVKGELIIYVDEATAEQLETSEVATRSGVTALDAAVMEIGAQELRPVFNRMLPHTCSSLPPRVQSPYIFDNYHQQYLE